MLKNQLVHLLTATVFCLIFNICNIKCQRLCNLRYLNDKIRIDGKVVIVTGGTNGLGFEAARNLAYRGGRIYIAARGEERGAEAVESIIRMTRNRNVKFIQLDLGSLTSVRQFSETFRSAENRLDILINNAGVVSHFNKTEAGFEVNMGVNHLGHFLLTNLLLDLLKSSAPSRIVVVSSAVHYWGVIFPTNLNSEIFFPGVILAYGNSKMANMLFNLELSKRLENTGVTVNSLDPGISMSELTKNLQSNIRSSYEFFVRVFGRSTEHAIENHIMLAVDPSVKNVSGKYFNNCEQQEPAPLATDENMALWLWNESAKLTGLYD